MKVTNKIATTVKMDPSLYDELKVLSIRHKFTLQSFVEKCTYLFINDSNFRDSINNFQVPLLSVSGSI
jgi:hypothetical protein